MSEFVRTNILKVIVFVLAVVALLGVTTLMGPTDVYAADAQSAACEAIGGTGGGDCALGGGEPTLEGTIGTIINIFSVIVGILAVLMIIVGGFKFITSGGDANKTKSGRDTILYAVVGLIIVAFAQAIVWFVLGNV